MSIRPSKSTGRIETRYSYVHHGCSSPAWWFLRGAPTRSHSEHGRENPQRQWYFVSRRGRVGRCRACQDHLLETFSHDLSSPRHRKNRRRDETPRSERLGARRVCKTPEPSTRGRRPNTPSQTRLRTNAPRNRTRRVKIEHRGVEQPGSSSGS